MASPPPQSPAAGRSDAREKIVYKPGEAPTELQLSFYMLLSRLEKLPVPGAEPDPSSPVGGTVSERKRKKEVLANLEAILGAFMEQKRAPAPSPRTWAEIFHLRMVHNRDLLTPELIDHWYELFSYFIKKGGNSSAHAAALITVAQELCLYLKTHRQDPDKYAVPLVHSVALKSFWLFSLFSFFILASLRAVSRVIDHLSLSLSLCLSPLSLSMYISLSGPADCLFFFV